MKQNIKNKKPDCLPIVKTSGVKMFSHGENTEGIIQGGAINRKEFLNSIARYGLAAMMLGLVAFFLLKRETTMQQACSNDFACTRCNKQGKCEIEKKLNPPLATQKI